MNTIVKSAEHGCDDYQVGIFKNPNGTYTALLSWKSKTYKTYAGAVKFMQKNNIKGF